MRKSLLQVVAGRHSLVLLLILFPCTLFAQSFPFLSDIQSFRKQDSVAFPPKKAILLIGSSSFTKWTDVQSYFPGYSIVNRGFGGSSLTDVIRYAPQIIYPYKPKQVLIYCGENDFAASDTVSANTVFNRFVKLFTLIRNKYHRIRIGYISMKPSPSRQHLRLKMETGNDLIAQFIKEQKKADYINVYNAMLQPDGKPMGEIFVSDSLHMNAKGYAIWQKVLAPYLLK